MTDTQVPPHVLDELTDRLKEEIKRINAARSKGYDSRYASLHAPTDEQLITEIEHFATRFDDTDLLILCGIGGSSLGAMAVHHAINGTHFSRPRVCFVDTVDADDIAEVLCKMHGALDNDLNVTIVGVSKSGGTTETIANFEVFTDALRERDPDYHERVVVISEPQSEFSKLANTRGYATLANHANVGGRYSVFSPVGLFPLAVLGINIRALCQGARNAIDQNLKSKSLAARRAATLFHHARHGRSVHNLFVFSKRLESVGKWHRQLLAESVGKRMSADGAREVRVGITPLVSVGSTDLHSMEQLFLGGPDANVHTFISLDETAHVNVPKDHAYDSLVTDIQGVSYKDLMGAILQGTMEAFRKQDIPFLTIPLCCTDEEHIGALLQSFMIETMLLGFLFGVDPFDQPEVEKYKEVTRQLLKK